MTLSPVDNSQPDQRKGHCGVKKGSLRSDPHRKDSRNYITPCPPSPLVNLRAHTRRPAHTAAPLAAIDPEFTALQFDQQAEQKGPTVSNSALRKTGSTRQWRRLRIPLLLELARRGFLLCAARRSPKCLIRITRPQDLRAGHVIARLLGGTDRHLQPECPPCSNLEGGQLAHQHQPTAPERKW